MSKRIQILVPEEEDHAMRQAARRRGMTFSEWVRQALRAAARQEAGAGSEQKLAAIRAAARNEFPTADIEQMLDEIQRGYRPEA